MIEATYFKPCSHKEITNKLLSVFGESNGENNCSVEDFAMGCQFMKPGTEASVAYSFSSGNPIQPETLKLSYTEGGNTTAVDLDLSLDDCTFDEASSTLEKIAAARCPEEMPQWGDPCPDHVGLTCNNFFCTAEEGWLGYLLPPALPPDIPCPEEEPAPFGFCEKQGMSCDYEFLNLSCEEGGLICIPTKAFTCSNTNEWDVNLVSLVECPTFPSTYMDPCFPV